MWSHNCMVSVWADCLSQLQVPYYIEPKHCYTTSSGGPDIYVAESFYMPAAELDIALSRPFSKDILSRAAYIDGAAACRVVRMHPILQHIGDNVYQFSYNNVTIE